MQLVMAYHINQIFLSYKNTEDIFQSHQSEILSGIFYSINIVILCFYLLSSAESVVAVPSSEVSVVILSSVVSYAASVAVFVSVAA